MKTNNSPIQLNETFTRLVSGATSSKDVVAERRDARTARIATEDAYSRRHREQAEAADPFGLNWCR